MNQIKLEKEEEIPLQRLNKKIGPFRYLVCLGFEKCNKKGQCGERVGESHRQEQPTRSLVGSERHPPTSSQSRPSILS